VTYFNTSFFAISLLPILIRNAGSHKTLTRRELLKGWWKDLLSLRLRPSSDHPVASARDITADEPLLTPDGTHHAYDARRSLDWEHPSKPGGMLNFRETAVLSFEFCLLWFAANYFVAACLEYTSVASSTILTSTSSIWTLMFGAFMKVEKFTVKKLVGVLVSFSGIILISMVDLNGDNDENRGNFPHKSQQQIAIGIDATLPSKCIVRLT
jgi:solute carrier family 35 protein F5